jgi:hypothetical protein
VCGTGLEDERRLLVELEVTTAALLEAAAACSSGLRPPPPHCLRTSTTRRAWGHRHRRTPRLLLPLPLQAGATAATLLQGCCCHRSKPGPPPLQALTAARPCRAIEKKELGARLSWRTWRCREERTWSCREERTWSKLRTRMR